MHDKDDNQSNRDDENIADPAAFDDGYSQGVKAILDLLSDFKSSSPEERLDQLRALVNLPPIEASQPPPTKTRPSLFKAIQATNSLGADEDENEVPISETRPNFKI